MPLNTRRSRAGVNALAWDGYVTHFPQGFCAICIESNSLHCYAEDGLRYVGTRAQRSCTEDAVHLLCRALQLAPRCYEHIELEASYPRAYLTIRGGVLVPG